MLKTNILNWDGKSTETVDLKKEIFSAEENKSILFDVVNWQLNKRRSGTHLAKTKGNVRGGGKKPFRQKGTGNARQGSIRSPLLEGGGVTHGPQPRDYGYALPKKVRKQALRVALSYLTKGNKVILIKDLKSTDGKTKTLNEKFKKLGWKKAVLIDEKLDPMMKRAVSNLKNFKFIAAEGLNVYDILKFDQVVLTPESLKTVYRKCGDVPSN